MGSLRQELARINQVSGRSLPGLPGGSQVPSLRGLRAVDPIGARAVIAQFGAMGKAAQDLGVIHAQNFDFQIARMRTLQSLEAEKALSRTQLTLQNAIKQVRENTEDASQIPAETQRVFDEIVNDFLAEESLTDFQKEYLAPKLAATRAAINKSAVEFQTQLEGQEAIFALEEMRDADGLIVFNDPTQRDAVLLQAEDRVETFGQGLSRLERAKVLDAYKNSIVVNAIRGEIENNPRAARERIEAGEFDKLGISAEQKKQLIDDAQTEERAVNSANSVRLKLKREQVAAERTDTLLREMSGDVDEQGNPIKLSINTIRKDLADGNMTSGTARALVEMKKTIATSAGNPAKTAKMLTEIYQRQGTNNPVSLESVVANAAPDPEAGEAGLNIAQLSSLRDAITKPADRQVGNFINTVGKASFFKLNELGVFQQDNPLRARAFFEFETALRNEADRMKENGQPVRDLFVKGKDGLSIAEGLVNQYATQFRDAERNFLIREAGDEVFPPTPPTQLPDGHTIREQKDSEGNRALVEFDANGNPVRVIKELPR